MNLQQKVLLMISTSYWRKFGAVSIYNDSNWKNVLRECHKTIPKWLQLIPLPIRKVLKRMIFSVGHEIRKFLKFMGGLSSEHDFLTLCFNHLCWTSKETVDIAKTVKVLTEENQLSRTLRFELASQCCFEKEILSLWEEMSRTEKSYYLCRRNESVLKSSLARFWALSMGSQRHISSLQKTSLEMGMNNISELAFYLSILKGNKDAVEFFWPKVDESKRTPIMISAFHEVFSQIGHALNRRYGYLLFRVNAFEDIPNNNFRYFSEIILFVFSQIEHKLRDVFLENTVAYNFFTVFFHESCIRSCRMILDYYFKNGYPLADFFQEIFIVFENAENDSMNIHDIRLNVFISMFKRSLILLGNLKRDIYADFLSIFVQFRDKECILLLLSHCSRRQKLKLFFHPSNINNCKELVVDEEWDLLTLLIDECVPKKKLRSAIREFRNSGVWFYRGYTLKDCQYQPKMISYLETIIQKRKQLRNK